VNEPRTFYESNEELLCGHYRSEVRGARLRIQGTYHDLCNLNSSPKIVRVATAGRLHLISSGKLN
jgi:hypothetical protein